MLLSKPGQVVLGPSLAGNRPKLKFRFRFQYGVPFKGMGVGGGIGPERLPNFGGALHEAYANASTRWTMKASEGELDESGNVSDGLDDAEAARLTLGEADVGVRIVIPLRWEHEGRDTDKHDGDRASAVHFSASHHNRGRNHPSYLTNDKIGSKLI